MLTASQVKSQINYDPITGHITWKVKKHNQSLNKKHAGFIGVNGRHEVVILGHHIMVHRAAWACMTGKWPLKQIDHIDGNPLNNKWENLRLANASENRQNLRKCMSNNVSGYLGVNYRKESGKYRARIRLDGKLHNIGTFDTAEEAYNAYLTKKREIHPFCTI